MIENFKLRVFRVVADTLSFRRAADGERDHFGHLLASLFTGR